jgi:hypothetical protein
MVAILTVPSSRSPPISLCWTYNTGPECVGRHKYNRRSDRLSGANRENAVSGNRSERRTHRKFARLEARGQQCRSGKIGEGRGASGRAQRFSYGRGNATRSRRFLQRGAELKRSMNVLLLDAQCMRSPFHTAVALDDTSDVLVV